MKKTTIVIDDDDDDECRRFMMHAISEHSSAMTEQIDVPIFCLDDDDEVDLNIDKDYKFFLDNLRDDNKLGPVFEPNASGLDRPIRYEDDNGESKTRKFNIFSGDSKRSKLENQNPMNNRVSQKRKRKNVEISKARIRERIERDNRIAERRKRRMAEKTSSAVPVPLIIKTEKDIRRDNIGKRKIPELKFETLRDVPISLVEEDTRPDKKARKISELMVVSSRKEVPLVRRQEEIQRDKKVKKNSELKNETLRDVPMKEAIGRDDNVESLRKHVRFGRIEEDDLGDNRMAERRKRNVSETKAVNETSRVVDVEAVNRVTELKAVDETSSLAPGVTQPNKGVGIERRSVVAIVDEDYMSYLTWLVDSLKEDSTTKTIENLQDEPSDIDTPVSDTRKESPEKDVSVRVKVEPDLESDDDIIEMGDSPFLDGEVTPFVVSKTNIDLDKEDESSSCLFRKELMDDLKRPYDERELWELSREVSIHRRVTGRRELRNGRGNDYEGEDLAPSYLDQYTDFNEKYKRVIGVDKAKALKLLRGFFFYLKKFFQAGAFKPWELELDG